MWQLAKLRFTCQKFLLSYECCCFTLYNVINSQVSSNYIVHTTPHTHTPPNRGRLLQSFLNLRSLPGMCQASSVLGCTDTVCSAWNSSPMPGWLAHYMCCNLTVCFPFMAFITLITKIKMVRQFHHLVFPLSNPHSAKGAKGVKAL